MAQEDRSRSSVFTWVSQLAEYFSSKSIMKACDLCNAECTVRRVGDEDGGDGDDGAGCSGGSVGVDGASFSGGSDGADGAGGSCVAGGAGGAAGGADS